MAPNWYPKTTTRSAIRKVINRALDLYRRHTELCKFGLWGWFAMFCLVSSTTIVWYLYHAELEPAMSLQQALESDSAVVAEEFLIRLNARVGQTLRLGGRSFRIAVVLKQERQAVTWFPKRMPSVL